MKNFKELSEREILALAISLEEEDERVYADFFEGLRQDYAGSASVFDSMRKEESEHRRRLIELYQQKFGDDLAHLFVPNQRRCGSITGEQSMKRLSCGQMTGARWRRNTRRQQDCGLPE